MEVHKKMASSNPLRHSLSSDFTARAEEMFEDRHSSSGSLVSLRRLNLHDRANSDTSLAHHNLQNRSSLGVDKHEYLQGSGDSVTVSWDIQETVSASDWIGLFLLGKSQFHPFFLADFLNLFKSWVSGPMNLLPVLRIEVKHHAM